MNRINERTVELTDLEWALIDDADNDWAESTDPKEFILDRAVEYGGVVSEEFVNYAVEHMVAWSVNGQLNWGGLVKAVHREHR